METIIKGLPPKNKEIFLLKKKQKIVNFPIDTRYGGQRADHFHLSRHCFLRFA